MYLKNTQGTSWSHPAASLEFIGTSLEPAWNRPGHMFAFRTLACVSKNSSLNAHTHMCLKNSQGTNWSHLAASLEPTWNWLGTGLEPFWNRAGTGLEPAWNRPGTGRFRLEPVILDIGFKMWVPAELFLF